MVGYNQRTRLQIRQSIQRKIRSTDTASGTFDLVTGIDRAVNDALEEIVRSANFEWTAREIFFNTTPAVNSGAGDTVSVTAGATTVTSAGTPFTSAMVGRFIRLANGYTPYEIVTFTSTASIEIVVGYEGSTNLVGAAWSVLQDTFTLNARVKKPRRMVIYDGTAVYPITFVPQREWDSRRRDLAQERPTYYTIYRWTADGVPQIRLYPIPGQRYVVRLSAYCYLPSLAADGDILEVPGPVHSVVEDMAHARVLAEILHDFGPEAQMVQSRANSALLQLIRENNTEPDWDPEAGAGGRGRFPQVIAWPATVGRYVS